MQKDNGTHPLHNRAHAPQYIDYTPYVLDNNNNNYRRGSVTTIIVVYFSGSSTSTPVPLLRNVIHSYRAPITLAGKQRDKPTFEKEQHTINYILAWQYIYGTL